MIFSKSENQLILYFTGRIDSANANGVDNEIKNIFTDNIPDLSHPPEVVFNLKELSYISSAGLRILLNYRKKKLLSRLTEVSNEVYEILEATGFQQLIPTERALRQVDITGCSIIAQGGNGVIYHLPGDEIVKVYVNGTDMEDIQREREYARRAFLSGVPTAISYDVVKCGEYYGIVFECVNADTLSKLLMTDPSSLPQLAAEYAQLMLTLHQTHITDPQIPRISELYHSIADRAAEYYTPEEVELFHRLIRAIPERDTMVHGDLNSNNVMQQGSELLLIDMAEVSRGNPIYDLFSVYFVHVLNISFEPGAVEHFLKLSEELSRKLWDAAAGIYFKQNKDMERIEAILRKLAAFRVAILPVLFRRIEQSGRLTRFTDYARKELFPHIPELEQEVKWLDELVQSLVE